MSSQASPTSGSNNWPPAESCRGRICCNGGCVALNRPKQSSESVVSVVAGLARAPLAWRSMRIGTTLGTPAVHRSAGSDTFAAASRPMHSSVSFLMSSMSRGGTITRSALSKAESEPDDARRIRTPAADFVFVSRQRTNASTSWSDHGASFRRSSPCRQSA
jgi:hypothetical protein